MAEAQVQECFQDMVIDQHIKYNTDLASHSFLYLKYSEASSS